MITAIGQAGLAPGRPARQRAGNQPDHQIRRVADLLASPLATMATVAQVESIGEGSPPTCVRWCCSSGTCSISSSPSTWARAPTADQMAAHYPNLVNPKRGGGMAGGRLSGSGCNSPSAQDRAAAIESASWGCSRSWVSLGRRSALPRPATGDRHAAQRGRPPPPCAASSSKIRHAQGPKGANWADVARRHNGSGLQRQPTTTPNWPRHTTILPRSIR